MEKLHSLHKLHTANRQGLGNNEQVINSNSNNNLDIFVTKIEGPTIVCSGAYYEFKVTKFDRNNFLLGEIDSKINWGYSTNNVDSIIKINNRGKGVKGKMEVVMKWKIPKNLNVENLKVYAWLVKPVENVSNSSYVLKYPFLFDKYKKKGLDRNALKIAEDMCYGNGITQTNHFAYTKQEVASLGYVMENITMNASIDSLWIDFKLMVNTLFTSYLYRDLKKVANKMIGQFESSKGGEFYDKLLSDVVKKHESTNDFCKKIEQEIKLILKKNFNNPVFLLNEKAHLDSTRYGRPIFHSNTDILFTGLTIMINDTWAYEILVTNFDSINGSNYNITYKVILYDHFGLDKPDLENNLYYSLAGFRAWFVLQHIHNHKPFITKIEFEKTFKS